MKSDLLHLLKTECYRRGDYKLSSGKKSPHYVNCKPVTLSGFGLSLVSPLMVDLLEDDTEAVAGLTLGADPLVSGVAMASYGYWAKRDVRFMVDGALIVRKEPKGHGTSAWVEGPPHPVDTEITVLEDVITTGGSAILAVNKLRDAGYYVKEVVTIIDRKEHDPFTFLDNELELISLYTLNQLV